MLRNTFARLPFFIVCLILAAPQAHALSFWSKKTDIPKEAETTTPASLPPSAPPVPRLIGDLETITSKYEDTLVHLARKYNVGFVELRAANPGIDPWLPGKNTQLIIPTQHILPDAPQQGIVINLPEMRMYFYITPGEPPASFPIGIGRSGLTTPLGTTTVERMGTDPIWYPTDRMRKEDPKLPVAVPPGPENPMGTHAMYLGWPSYAIHGTDKPYSIGRRLSSGCIRMYPEDILTVFDNVDPGTQVTVVDQPVKTAWINDQYYIQVHPTQEQSDILSKDAVHHSIYPLNDADIKTILAGAGDATDHLDWAKIKKAVRERRGIPIIVGDRTQTPGTASDKAKSELTPEPKKAPDKPAKKPVPKSKDNPQKS
jgi:L,D-transpeptidase ErfK/SrfK